MASIHLQYAQKLAKSWQRMVKDEPTRKLAKLAGSSSENRTTKNTNTRKYKNTIHKKRNEKKKKKSQ
jgi:hypothetical protein